MSGTETEQDPYARAGAYFSHEVELLEELDRSNPIHAYIRRESIATLEHSFAPPGPLLEFGFGTGTEAIHLATRGFDIVGVDPSAAMLARAREKARTAGVAQRCDFRAGSTGDAGRLLEQFGRSAFAGAFATLGPLNLEPDLPRFARGLADLVRSGGAFVCLMINRYCVWETVLFGLRGDFRRAFRREVRGWSDLVDSTTGERTTVLTYTPGSVARAFADSFEVEACFGLPSVLPPPYAANRMRRLPGLLEAMTQADRKWRERWPLRSLGDHFEIVLRRR